MKKTIRNLRRNLKLLRTFSFKELGSGVSFASTGTNNGFFFPYSNKSAFDRRQIHNLSHGFKQWLLSKYTEGDVQIRNTDTVIDCGAFVGGFSIASAGEKPVGVYSIEPSRKNYQCLLLNIAFHETSAITTALNIGLADKPGVLELNLSNSGCDNSFMTPDEGETGETESVEVSTLALLIEKYQIAPKDLYLKVEAEGFEPEIIKGLGDKRPRVVVVDVTAERDNQSPREEIQSLLEDLGYKNFIQTVRCLFAISHFED